MCLGDGIADFLLYRVFLIHTLRYQVTLLLAEVMILKESSPQFRKFTSSTIHGFLATLVFGLEDLHFGLVSCSPVPS